MMLKFLMTGKMGKILSGKPGKEGAVVQSNFTCTKPGGYLNWSTDALEFFQGQAFSGEWQALVFVWLSLDQTVDYSKSEFGKQVGLLILLCCSVILRKSSESQEYKPTAPSCMVAQEPPQIPVQSCQVFVKLESLVARIAAKFHHGGQ
jgi:hypothetical protein